MEWLTHSSPPSNIQKEKDVLMIFYTSLTQKSSNQVATFLLISSLWLLWLLLKMCYQMELLA
jgi:hypothetical protein